MNLFEYIVSWAEKRQIERQTGLINPSCLPSSICSSSENNSRLDFQKPLRKLSLPHDLESPNEIVLSSAIAKKYELGGEAILISNDSTRFQEAFLLVKEACIHGLSMNAVAILGFCYEFGLGECINYALAESAYVLAAEKGSIPLALSRLAFLRKYGQPGLPIDKNEADHWSMTLSAHGTTGALSWLTKASDSGLPQALYCLGICYHDGFGCAKDEIRAFHLYKQAADRGLSRAYGILGYCYGEGFGIEKDHIKSIFFYEKAIETSYNSSFPDTVSLFNLGCCYEDGSKGVSKDLNKAACYYKKAAEAGNAYAQSALGYFYEYGIGGLEINLQTAAALYKLSAEQGYPWAQTNIGYCYQQGIGVLKDTAMACWWYSKAAGQGHPRALHNLGHCYQTGLGIPCDREKAFKLFEQSSAQGHIFAFHSLGHCYQHGLGVAVNLKEAFNWYLKASEMDHGPAQLSLAYCYKSGIGCDQNMGHSIFWFEKAANNGIPLAQNIMGSFCELGIQDSIIPKDAKAAVEWYKKAAAQDLTYAICNLALCYEKGNGVEQCHLTAFKLYESAAFKGHPRAMDKLGLCYFEGIGTIADRELATLWFKRSAESGYALGMLHYGESLETGSGIERSTSDALTWYQLAISKGRKEAIDKLRCLLLKLSNEKSEEVIRYGHTACAA